MPPGFFYNNPRIPIKTLRIADKGKTLTGDVSLLSYLLNIEYTN